MIVEDVTDQPNLAGPIQEMDEATEHVVATSVSMTRLNQVSEGGSL